jgi:hypothetical protein
MASAAVDRLLRSPGPFGRRRIYGRSRAPIDPERLHRELRVQLG